MSFIIKSMPFSFGIGMHDVKYMYINKRSKIKYEQTATTKNDGKDKPALCRRKESWCVCVCVCVCVCDSVSRAPLFETPWTVAHQAPTSMGFSSKNTGVGCLLEGIFPTQGSNLSLPHCRQTLQSESPGKQDRYALRDKNIQVNKMLW